MTDGDIVINSDDGHCTKRSRWVRTAWALLIVVKRHTQLASTALVATLVNLVCAEVPDLKCWSQ